MSIEWGHHLIQSALVEKIGILDLHLNQKNDPPIINRLDVQNAFLELRKVRPLPRIFQRDVLDPPVAIQLKQRIQKTNQDLLVLFVAENLFEGYVGFDIDKLHNIPCSPCATRASLIIKSCFYLCRIPFIPFIPVKKP